MQLVKADSEAEVIAILKTNKLWDDPTAWTEYGKNENNWSIIGNQQGQPEAALVEKIINGGDSVLMAQCRREKLNPSSDKGKVPKSIKEALHRYFNIGKDHLAGLTSQERTALAEKTSGLVATGAKQRPCYAIFDFGEGQNGSAFFETFLSLAKSNKLSVPFVQGKFNQGSTGALRFCGKHCIQLILSKRDPQISDADGQWSFTVTRRIEPDEKSGRRSSVICCLSPSGKMISFDAASLPILPTKTSAYGRDMPYGSYVKLYEYSVPAALTTNILFDLNYRLSSLLVEPILPVRLYERRAYSGHTLETTLNGLELRLLEDKQNIETGFPVGGLLKTVAGEFKYRIIAFKKEASTKRYSGSDGVLFTINGQTHGAFPRTFFQRKAVGMDYLAQSLIVVVDCSALSAHSVEQIFMPSRDRLASGSLTKELEHALADTIRENGSLQELRKKRRQEELEAKIGDNQQAQQIFNKIVRKSPILSKLLITGEKIVNPYSAQANSDAGKKEFKPSYSPTTLELLRPNSLSNPRRAEVGRTARIQLGTDAPNDYLIRSLDQGTFTLSCEDGHHFQWQINPFDGIWTLNVSIPDNFPIDQILTFRCTLEDDTMAAPLEAIFWLRTVPYIAQEAQGGGHKKKKNPNEGTGQKGPSAGLAMPNIVEVREQEWETHDFNQHSALKVVNSGDNSYDFFVNMDNLYLTNELKGVKTEKIILENRFKLALVFIGVAILAEDGESSGAPSSKDDQDEPSLTRTELVRQVSEWVAPIVLPLVNELSNEELGEVYAFAE